MWKPTLKKHSSCSFFHTVKAATKSTNVGFWGSVPGTVQDGRAHMEARPSASQLHNPPKTWFAASLVSCLACSHLPATPRSRALQGRLLPAGPAPSP